ncbi:MAG: DUF4190 domain-containing protein [Nanoarchaeota archaeon]
MNKPASPGIFWGIHVLISIAVLIVLFRSYRTYLFRFNYGYLIIIFSLLLCSIYTYLVDRKKSKSMALTSYVFGLFTWVPLLNLFFGVLAIYLGLKAIGKIKKDATKYGGKWFAIIGIILGIIVYINYLTGLGMCIYGIKSICNAIGLTFLT